MLLAGEVPRAGAATASALGGQASQVSGEIVSLTGFTG